MCGQRCNSLGAYRLWGERGGCSLRASVPDGILGGVDPTLLHNHTRDLAVGVAPTVQAPDLTPQSAWLRRMKDRIGTVFTIATPVSF